jgi:broad specificity phosphatase PhoE
MKPKRIVLVRHGQSEANVDKSIYLHKQDHIIDLTETGKQQAVTCSKELKNLFGNESVRVYSSPYNRAIQTLDILQPHINMEGKPFLDPRIREQEWGNFRNLEEVKLANEQRNKYGSFFFRLPNGESCADVFDRVSGFMSSMHRAFDKLDFPDNTLLITHGCLIRVFLMRWFRWDYTYFQKINNPANCSIVLLEKYNSEKYELVDYTTEEYSEYEASK